MAAPTEAEGGPPSGARRRWRARLASFKQDTYAISLALGDPRTPWHAKVAAGLVVAYALSPIDLIPDFIPVLGYLDDLLLVPIGIAIVIRLVPPSVMADCRAQAARRLAEKPPASLLGGALVALAWTTMVAVAYLAWRLARSHGA